MLELRPGAGMIRLQLHHKKLSQRATRYEAISYAWGDELETEEITLDSNAHKITRNLWTCLKKLRLSTEPRALWADAVCINQNDPAEKGHQVSIMGKIYREAKRVCVWLGEADDGTDAIMSTVMESRRSPRSAECHAAIKAILSRPYWRRT